MDLAHSIKNKNINVSVSGLIQRNDFLNEKVLAVNGSLKNVCDSTDIRFIDNGNIRPDIHLNASKLHLNKRGNTIFISNIRNFLYQLFWPANSGENSANFSFEIRSNNSSGNDIDCDNSDLSNDQTVTSFNDNSIISSDSSDKYDKSPKICKTEGDLKFDGIGFVSDRAHNDLNELKNIKLKNINRISVAKININSLRNKFEFFEKNG